MRDAEAWLIARRLCLVAAALLAHWIGVGIVAYALDGHGRRMAVPDPPTGAEAGAGARSAAPDAGPETGPGMGGEHARPGLPRSVPTSVEVPAIGVRAALLRVGQEPDGALAAPPASKAGMAGWYEYGPSPGERGAAVLVGHRDSRTGPAVFYRLGRLRTGDTIRVRRADGGVATFRVESIDQVDKDAFPTRRVHGDLPYPALRLISCAGSFDPEARSYRENVIVYARYSAGQSAGQSADR